MERLQSLGLLLALKGLLPFIMVSTTSMVNGPKEGQLNINIARIIEALIVAIITALATSFISVKLLEQRLDFVDQQQKAYVVENAEYRKNLQKQIDKLQNSIETCLLTWPRGR